jgi:hypothetical protein
MKEIDELAAALRQADAPPPAPVKRAVDTYHAGITHDARMTLLDAGIDDERMATAITLARAEERAAKIAAGGFDVPWPLKREIAHLNNQLN